jgi:CheY-like chemotaxis protein
VAGLDETLKRRHVALIDYNKFHRMVAAEALRGLGASRLYFGDCAAAALELARAAPVDLLVYDWQLPDFDGVDLARRIRAGDTPMRRDVPIILVTGRSSATWVDVARNAGVDEYVVKPFTIGVLAARLEAALIRQRPFVAAVAFAGPCRRRRPDPEFVGPRKRLFDEGPTREDVEAIRTELVTTVRAIGALAETTRAGDRVRIRELHGLAGEALALAETFDDQFVRVAISTLSAYLKGVGASERFDGDIVKMHASALDQMLSFPRGPLRERVSSALSTLVKQRLAVG